MRLNNWLIAALLLVGTYGYSQQLPLGNWRTHFSYNSASLIEQGGEGLYVSSGAGLFYYDRQDNSVQVIGKLDGLQEVNIAAMAYDQQSASLYIGYQSGNMDMLDDEGIVNYDLTTSSQVLGDKSINHILPDGDRAFISTAYGLLNFSLNGTGQYEEYRQLGENAERLEVLQAAIAGDSIFLATANGVLSSNINNGTNLLNPDNWKRHYFESQNLINGIISINGMIVAVVDGSGLYAYSRGTWQQIEHTLTGEIQKIRGVENEALLIASTSIYRMDQSLNLTAIPLEGPSEPNDALLVDETLFVADANTGLIVYQSGLREVVQPDGPASDIIFNMVEGNAIITLAGGYNDSFEPLQRMASASQYSNGNWTSVESLGDYGDISDAEFAFGNLYLASFTNGLIALAEGDITVFDNSNAPLQAQQGFVSIPALSASSSGLWLINYGATLPLKFYDGEWAEYNLLTDEVTEMVVTRRYVFMASTGGLQVFDIQNQQLRLLTSLSGNGGLPSNNITALAIDAEGQLWVGTSRGIGYYSSATDFNNGAVDLIIPIFESRFLLRDAFINDINIDPGNRKWVGTNDGVWLFDANLTEVVHYFDQSNSPLPADEVLHIAVEPQYGEVFFSTAAGLVSYRGDATVAAASHTNVKIFPNPVTPGYDGTIAISGLVFDAEVKITDASGRLIYATRSAGGTATWHGRDYNGSKAAPGVYFVFSADSAGEETFIGKIAVVH